MRYQEFSFYLKNRIFIARSKDTIFIFHVWRYWCRHGYLKLNKKVLFYLETSSVPIK